MPKKPELTPDEQALRERLGASIRLISASQGVKPQDLAKACGVSLANQYRIEGGEATPDAIYLVKVAHLLGMSIDALIAGQVPAEDTQPETQEKTYSRGRPAMNPPLVKAAQGASQGVVNKAGKGSVQAGHISGHVTVTTHKGRKP